MMFRVVYLRRDDLRQDLDAQLARGGLFFTVPAPEGALYGSALDAELVAPSGVAVRFRGEVLAVAPGQGFALSVPPAAVQSVREALAGCDGDASPSGPPRHERVEASAAPSTNPGAETARPAGFDPVRDWDSLGPADKMRLAQHGGRDERGAALRDRNRALHPMVLKNPRLSLDEVVAIARNPQAAPDLLKLIAERSDWMGRSTVAEALARNPKTPGDVGVRALAGCGAEAIRQIAKGVGAPPHIVQAARKRLLG